MEAFDDKTTTILAIWVSDTFLLSLDVWWRKRLLETLWYQVWVWDYDTESLNSEVRQVPLITALELTLQFLFFSGEADQRRVFLTPLLVNYLSLASFDRLTSPTAVRITRSLSGQDTSSQSALQGKWVMTLTSNMAQCERVPWSEEQPADRSDGDDDRA